MNRTISPTLVMDTCAIDCLSSTLQSSHIPIEAVVGNKKFPTVVITDTIGSEIFGKECFGNFQGVIANTDSKGYVNFKPWAEAKKALIKQSPPSGLLMEKFLPLAERQYTLLDELSKQHKLIVVKTPACSNNKQFDGTPFTGYKSNAGEESIASLFAMEHPLMKSHVAVIITDHCGATDVFSQRLYKEDEASPPPDTIAMNALKFGVALRGSDILTEQQFRDFKKNLPIEGSVDLLKSGKKHQSDYVNNRLRLATTDASLTLFRWIKEAAQSGSMAESALNISPINGAPSDVASKIIERSAPAPSSLAISPTAIEENRRTGASDLIAAPPNR